MADEQNGNATEHGENQEQAKGNTEHGAENAGTIPKARLDKEIERRKALEAQLNTLADELAQDVPEDFRGLIPNLPPADKVAWIRSANKSGLFKRNPAESGPGAQRPGPKSSSLDGLNPQQMMSQGYGK